MSRTMMEDLGRLVLRVTLGVLMLLHGIAKLRHGVDKIAANVGRHGLPEAFGYLVYLGEVIAPILVLIGLFTRPAALIYAINMLFAYWLVHTGDIGKLTPGGGWRLELQALYFMGAIAIMLLGAGRYSVRRGANRWD